MSQDFKESKSDREIVMAIGGQGLQLSFRVRL